MRKKIFGLALIVYAGCIGMLLFGLNGNAYIDPSVITYLIQAVAGVAIAVGAVVGLYFRKVKKRIQDKMGIDEQVTKEVESDEIIVQKKSKE